MRRSSDRARDRRRQFILREELVRFSCSHCGHYEFRQPDAPSMESCPMCQDGKPTMWTLPSAVGENSET